MKLCLLNGSPRGKGSNTRILMEQFEQGFTQTSGNSIDIHYLNRTRDNEVHLEAFMGHDVIMLAYPLYTDAMPGIVKHFIDSLDGKGPFPGKKIMFLVQSGFPEARHSHYVKRYSEKLARRLGMDYLGTITRGGVEGIQIMPPMMTRKLFYSLREMGQHFGETGSLPQDILEKLARPWKMSLVRRMFFRFFSLLGFTNFYWNSNLKKHNAYDQRFDHPYGE